MQQTEPDKVLRLTMLFHDIGKPETMTTDEEGIDHFHGHAAVSAQLAEETLRQLKFDNDTLSKVTKLVLEHDRKIVPDKKHVRRALQQLGEEIFLLLLKVKKADTLAQSDYMRREKLDELAQLKRLCEEVKEAQECFCVKDLAVTGRDLLGLGMSPGPQVGRTLSQLLALVIEDPSQNTKENLLEKVRESIF
jgi:tRNA nucleotidyltransferase (CCA-adding enzyme)